MHPNASHRSCIAVRAGIVAVALASVFAAPAGAQVKTPSMFSLPPTRNPLGQPYLQPDGYVRDEAIVPALPLAPEDRGLADLNGPRMKRMIEEIANISRKDRDMGTVFWGRNIGTPGHEMAQQWTLANFKRLGLSDVRLQPEVATRPVWFANSYDISFTAGGTAFKLPSARPSQSESTPAGGLDMELVWLGLGSEADFIGRDVRGKAVLIQDIPLPGDIRHSAAIEQAAKRALDNGAAAVGMIFGISDNFSLWQSTGGKYGFNLGYRDGMRLKAMLGKGERVRLKYNLSAEFKTGVKSNSVLGLLPGATDEQIVVVAHMDGYFESALDNASGMAMMVEMAEHYAKIPKAQRRRSILFVGSVGHHGGPGTTVLHQTLNWPKVAYIVNLEHVAVNSSELWGPTLRMSTGTAPLRWTMNASPAAFNMVKRALELFNVPVIAEIDGTVGEISAILQDAPSLTLITSPVIKHTEQDTPEWVPTNGMIQVARAHTYIIDQINKMDRKDIMFTPWPPTPARTAAPAGDN